MNNNTNRVNHEEKESKEQAEKGFDFGKNQRRDDLAIVVEKNMLETAKNSLAETKVGERVRLVELDCDSANSRLRGMGLIPGAFMEIISKTADGSVVVALQDQRLGLGADLAHQIQVIAAESAWKNKKEKTAMKPDSNSQRLKLRDCAVGNNVRVVGYEPTARTYKRKLLAMGLTPGTEFSITRHAPLGDPTEIEVRGFHLSLRKDEADALLIELI